MTGKLFQYRGKIDGLWRSSNFIDIRSLPHVHNFYVPPVRSTRQQKSVGTERNLRCQPTLGFRFTGFCRQRLPTICTRICDSQSLTVTNALMHISHPRVFVESSTYLRQVKHRGIIEYLNTCTVHVRIYLMVFWPDVGMDDNPVLNPMHLWSGIHFSLPTKGSNISQWAGQKLSVRVWEEILRCQHFHFYSLNPRNFRQHLLGMSEADLRRKTSKDGELRCCMSSRDRCTLGHVFQCH